MLLYQTQILLVKTKRKRSKIVHNLVAGVLEGRLVSDRSEPPSCVIHHPVGP